ncbi:unnamed protein product [Periconia digitata]|uniref:Uncharacterized protein n=1 Tax=Periconia digitata TaxID=1303443 RepID=A0A9W4UM33_9PLEO|nr:unnamed protein product [Periconia digitata]
MKLTLFTLIPQALFAFSNAAAVELDNAAAEVTLEPRAPCTLYAWWKTNWNEAGLRRYRVQIGQDPGGSNEYSERFCDVLYHRCYSWSPIANPQCFWDTNDRTYYADLSFAEGPAGHSSYVDSFQHCLNNFRAETACDVNSNL